MTVAELILALQSIPDKDMEVCYYDDSMAERVLIVEEDEDMVEGASRRFTKIRFVCLRNRH